jgi:glutathione S-transferase
MYSLYYSPGAASFAVHWLLNEIKAPHELVLVDFESKQQKSNDYMKLNPSGLVPTLLVDGVPHTECAALLVLLAERHSMPALIPPTGTSERALFFQWMFYFANTLQPAFRSWFYPHEPAGEAHIDVVKAQARQTIETIWERVAAQVTGRKYIVGETLTAVDFLGTMLMRWSRNMPKPATEWPTIDEYARRMRSMPSHLRTHQAENLTGWLNE